MNQDEFYQRVREIAQIEKDISLLQERLHILYHEVAIQAQEGIHEANPGQKIPTQATSSDRPDFTKR